MAGSGRAHNAAPFFSPVLTAKLEFMVQLPKTHVIARSRRKVATWQSPGTTYSLMLHRFTLNIWDIQC